MVALCRLSLRYQLRNNNTKKEVEIVVTSRRLAQPAGRYSYLPPQPGPLDGPACSYLPPPPTGMTSAGPGLSATFIPGIMPQQVYHLTPPPSSFNPFSYDNSAPSSLVTIRELPCYDTGSSIPYNYDMVPHASPPLTASHELDFEDLADEDSF